MAARAMSTGSHGTTVPAGLDRALRTGLEPGRYGRMFRTLTPLTLSDEELRILADSMVPGGPLPPAPAAPVAPATAAAATAAAPAARPPLQPGDNPDIPSGYTYLGQFVDHDITFDPSPLAARHHDPNRLVSYRTPRLDLDSLYGSGPVDSPYLYDQDDPAKLLVGRNAAKAFELEDLPRNHQGRALIGDPRNDVHFILTQLTLAFIRFHNAIVDHLRKKRVPEEDVFAEAQRLTRWHYQWVVVEDYLRTVAGSAAVDKVLVGEPGSPARRADLRFFTWKKSPFMPVEFSAAAYRFGHSQARATYQLNPSTDLLHILVPTQSTVPHLGGFRPLPKGWKISWDMFFTIGRSRPQPSRRIDTNLTGPFIQLPAAVDPERRSLALLDLLRARTLGLPSGQAVARVMGTATPDATLDLVGPTPLWYYLLKEAEVLNEGRRLGPTGAAIVAEVLVGMLQGDPASFLRVAPGWVPELRGARKGRFTIVDLLRFAGELAPAGR